ncbi:unnamed protein product [Rhizophagus irregularis]|nr:unnamed protein product [Rhizophagus irregularis]
MEKFECLISTFIGEDIIQINPEIFSGELLYILITYDEYLFYSNDNQPIVWELIANPNILIETRKYLKSDKNEDG